MGLRIYDLTACAPPMCPTCLVMLVVHEGPIIAKPYRVKGTCPGCGMYWYPRPAWPARLPSYVACWFWTDDPYCGGICGKGATPEEALARLKHVWDIARDPA